MQIALVNMCKKGEKLAAMPEEERRRYFFVAVYNAAKTQLRRDAQESAVEHGPDRTSDASEQWVDDLLLRLAIDRLPPEERKVAALVFIAGLSIAEVAKTTGVSWWTVKRRLASATRKLASLDLTDARGRPSACHAVIA